ncbi:MAG TPA: hypothetical protein VFS40_11315 [Gemmatimonadales bacterium]|nr:hypothetical protein [Gemmatimonadales bacterium]
MTGSRRRLFLLGPLALALAVVVGVARGRAPADRFDHWRHRELFPSCQSCHAGAASAGAPLWPDSAGCAACHDGKVERRVDWRPPSVLPATNLRFTHPTHAAAVARRRGADSALACAACHTEAGEPRMQVRLAVPRRCLDCHGVRAAHLEAPDTACATCHLPLPQATRLAAADVARFPTPPSHRAAEFALGGHGRAARAGPGAVAASCATCHAQNFCLTCHVNALEVPAIQALASDPRATAIKAELRAPPSHARPDFQQSHGGLALARPATCAACHTQQSCLTCHTSLPDAARGLATAGAGRGAGAVVTRRRPPSHGQDFTEAHARVASARSATCATCHVQDFCLSCHRPDPASAPAGYHPAGFLARHPAAAYNRQTDCSDCHNTRAFCTQCHAQAGLAARGPLRSGYHDAQPFFLVGHGKAARQNLESCASCHAERDCLTCHSALSGRHFNPHGPGFDADRLRRKNSQMCTVCHGAAIPRTGGEAAAPDAAE